MLQGHLGRDPSERVVLKHLLLEENTRFHQMQKIMMEEFTPNETELAKAKK